MSIESIDDFANSWNCSTLNAPSSSALWEGHRMTVQKSSFFPEMPIAPLMVKGRAGYTEKEGFYGEVEVTIPLASEETKNAPQDTPAAAQETDASSGEK